MSPSAQTPPPVLALFAKYGRPELGRALLLGACLLAGVGLSLAAPLVIRQLIDSVAAGGAGAALATLWRLAGLFLAVTLGAQTLRLAAGYLGQRVGWAATNRLRHDLATHALNLDLAFHHAHPPGEMIERLDGDVAELSGVFSTVLLQITGAVLTVAGVLVVLLAEDWRAGMVLGGLAFTAFAVLLATRNLAVDAVALERQSRSELAGFLEERIGGLDDIRGNAAGGYVMRRLGEVTAILNARTYRAAFSGRVVWVLSAAMFVAASLAALALGVRLFQQRQTSLGAVYLYVQYAAMMREPFYLIGAHLQEVQRAGGSWRRITDLLAMTPAVRDGLGPIAASTAPGVSFERVGFGYAGGPAVLSDVSFSLAPGEVLGVVGRTGVGKTTLTRLLCRLHDPTEGVVRLDGRDLREARLSDLRARIGVVTQDVRVFGASVRDNVSLFDPDIPDANILAALSDLGLGPWLARQPGRLDARLAGSSSLSAGEAQLLAFARVFLRDPGLLILDEATSRVDPATDRLIERATERLLRGPAARTAIIIAHKLETVRRADRILVLEGGRIAEFGPRAELERDPASRFSHLLAGSRGGVLT